jgi:hypothetical protein
VRRALLIALLLLQLLPTAAGAASLELRVAERLAIDAPSVSTLPSGATSVVAVLGYRDLGPGTTVQFQLLNATGGAIAQYREPVAAGGSGTAVVRLLPTAPLSPGTYAVQATVDGAPPVSAPFTVGGGAAPAEPSTAPGSGGAAPAPVQLGPRSAAPATLASVRLADDPGGRPTASDAGSSSTAPPWAVGATPARTRPTGPDQRFGLANVLPDGWGVPGVAGSDRVAWMSLARQAGAGANRWELRWDAIEQSPGQYDWRAVDAVVAANEAAGLPLLAVLIGTPTWAGSAAGAPPRGLAEPPILPDGAVGPNNPWAGFVHAVAARYRGRIAAYEVWNEPNRPDFWSGSPREYYRLLSAAMASIRHADPAATVVFGGLDGYREPSFLEAVLDAAAADDAPPGRPGAFDALAWHAYHRPLDVYVGTRDLRERLRARGLTQPIWVTEANVPAWDDRAVRGELPAPYRWSATAEEQATYVLETFAYALAADVERLFLYRASDAGEGEAWGLRRADGVARPAESAFRFATERLAGALGARRIEEAGVERIVVDRPGERVTVAWATGSTDAPLVFEAVSTGAARLYDKVGGTGAVAPVDGRFVLSLPGASANQGSHPGDYVIGGDPYVIVEARP